VRIAELDDRLDAAEYRMDSEISRLERRILALEIKGGS
jgi:hypothetical protein